MSVTQQVVDHDEALIPELMAAFETATDALSRAVTPWIETLTKQPSAAANEESPMDSTGPVDDVPVPDVPILDVSVPLAEPEPTPMYEALVAANPQVAVLIRSWSN